MNISQIVCTYPPYKGGMGNSAYNIGEILKTKHQVTTFTPLYETTENNGAIRLKPWLKYGNGALLPQLFFRLKKFDCVYLHYPFFGAAEIIWLFKIFNPKIKLFIHFHMDTPGLSPLAKLLSLPSKLITTPLFNKADKIICASLDYIKESSLKKIYEKNPEKFIEIPFGVDIEKFKPAPPSEGLHKPLEDEKCFTLLFVGGLDKAHNFKGLPILFEALSKLQIVNCKLFVVGSGDMQNDYENLAKELQINDKVKFLGNVTDAELPDIYNQADVFILPSIDRNEAFGMVLLEALSSGVPVIASNLPGVRKVFENNIQGLFVKPNNADDLKEKIEYLYNNKESRIEMGKNARQLAKEKYDEKLIREKYLEIFE